VVRYQTVKGGDLDNNRAVEDRAGDARSVVEEH
jgi:hypothetical protein